MDNMRQNRKGTGHIVKTATILFLTIVTAIAMTACSTGSYTGTEGDPSKASLAVLYSHPSKEKTAIQWLDGDLNVVGTSKYPYAGADVSFENARVSGGDIFLAPVGPFDAKDERDILSIDGSTGDAHPIELPDENHMSCDVEGSAMVVSGNGNGEVWIDLIDLDTREITTYRDSKLWDAGIMQVTLIGGEVYGTGSDTDKSCIYRIDVEDETVERIYECPDDPSEYVPSYFEKHGSDLVFLSDGKLIKYDTKNDKTKEIRLTRGDHAIVNVRDDLVWLAYTDQHDDGCDSLIEVRDYEAGKVIGSFPTKGAILQLEPARDALYAAGYDRITRFAFDGRSLSRDRELELDPQYEDFNFGGIFSLDR